MDDRDKAGDPDSNPEIDDSESEESLQKKHSLPIPKKRVLTKLKTFYLENFKDPDDDNSVMMDQVTIDMGQRLSKIMQDY